MRLVRYGFDIESLPKLTSDDGARNEARAIGPKAIFENYLFTGARAKFGQKFSAAQHRMLQRILTSLDAAKDDFITVEESEYELLKDIFINNEGFDPAMNRLLCHWMSAISEATVIKTDEAK